MSQCSLIVEQYVDCEQKAPLMDWRSLSTSGPVARVSRVPCALRWWACIRWQLHTYLAAASRADDELRISAHALPGMLAEHDKAALVNCGGEGARRFNAAAA